MILDNEKDLLEIEWTENYMNCLYENGIDATSIHLLKITLQEYLSIY